jgi:hypothetical protein
MMSVTRMIVIGPLLFAAPIRAAGSGDASKTKAVTPDPNERVCQDMIVTGSRLAKSRFCGTRAEWEARQKQDRDVIEDAQRRAADPCHAILTHIGPPNCG